MGKMYLKQGKLEIYGVPYATLVSFMHSWLINYIIVYLRRSKGLFGYIVVLEFR